MARSVRVKGAVIGRCPTDAARLTEHHADPSKGFHWPYLLYVPGEVHWPHLLVAPNNTGFATEDAAFLRASGSCDVARSLGMIDRLGVPLLVPLFPRPAVAGEEENLYLHALTRASLTTKIPAFKRVDLQLIAMVEDARAVLAEAGARVTSRVLLTGFSASGSFVNRFALLHPENVRDSFSKSQQALVFRLFGTTPVSRWKKAERLYTVAGLNARFLLYPGVGHTTTREIDGDVEAFFVEAMKKMN